MNRSFLIQVMCVMGVVLLSACSADEQEKTPLRHQPLSISGVFSDSYPLTRAATDVPIEDENITIYVSSNGALPSPYKYDATSHQYVVKTGYVPQEWDGSNAYVYGFIRSDAQNASSLTATYSVSSTQNGSEGYSFQASTQKKFAYTDYANGGVTLYLKQQLAKVQIKVADATDATKVYMGNNQIQLSGNFGQNFTANANEITGTWSLSGNGYTIEMSGNLIQNETGRIYTAYILPQTVSLATQFFQVSDGSLSAYYALPNNNYTFLAGHQYNCILMQNMYVASISVDEEFANGSIQSVETTAVAN